MLASCVIGVFCGLLLGSRFKVFSVIVAQLMAVILTIGFSLWIPLSPWVAISGLLCWSLMLQVGYVGMLAMGLRGSRALRPIRGA